MLTSSHLWSLSPSGLYNFIGCPSCFWVDQHVGRAPMLPLSLNNAMDAKLKSRYDSFRKKGILPPEISNLKGVKLYPDVTQLNVWRENKSALRYTNEKDGYELAGKIDELFVNRKGELLVADYKSSGDEPGPMKLGYYTLQLHAYAFLFHQKGFKVANTAYLLNYYPKNRTNASTNVELACKVTKAPLDLPAFQKTLKKMVKFLNSEYPNANEECRTCAYHVKRRKYLGAK